MEHAEGRILSQAVERFEKLGKSLVCYSWRTDVHCLHRDTYICISSKAVNSFLEFKFSQKSGIFPLFFFSFFFSFVYFGVKYKINEMSWLSYLHISCIQSSTNSFILDPWDFSLKIVCLDLFSVIALPVVYIKKP